MIPSGTENAKAIRAIHFDEGGDAWVATSGHGLHHYDGSKLTVISSAQGLMEDMIYSVTEDNHGRIWMSANSGIFWVSKVELRALIAGKGSQVNSVAYNKQDGMKSHECNGSFQPAAWKSQDGRIWFPTVEGPVVVNPARLAVKSPAPHIVIEEVIADGKRMDHHRGIALEPGTRKLSVRYSAPTFVKPRQVRYRYQLLGEDPVVVDAGHERVAHYGNLSPGKYSFEVSLVTSQGNASALVSPIQLSLQPYFYQTMWFRVLSLIGLAGLVYFLYRLRVHQLRARKIELEHLVAVQTGKFRPRKKK